MVRLGAFDDLISRRLKDHHPQRVYRLYDFSKSQLITLEHRCVAGKVNSADRPYLVIESIKRDTKRDPLFTAASTLLQSAQEEMDVNAWH